MSTWYKSFPWIHFCSESLRVYCYYCQQTFRLKVSVISSKTEPAFISTGFCNWKKATILFREHEQSQTHRDAIAAHMSAKSTPVNAMLQSEVDNIRSRRRNSLMKQLSALRYLLQQGLSIRNDHSGGSNLTVMLQDVLDESSWVECKKYQSPEIVNEIVQLLAHKVLRSLISDLLSQTWFALLADEILTVNNLLLIYDGCRRIMTLMKTSSA